MDVSEFMVYPSTNIEPEKEFCVRVSMDFSFMLERVGPSMFRMLARCKVCPTECLHVGPLLLTRTGLWPLADFLLRKSKPLIDYDTPPSPHEFPSSISSKGQDHGEVVGQGESQSSHCWGEGSGSKVWGC